MDHSIKTINNSTVLTESAEPIRDSPATDCEALGIYSHWSNKPLILDVNRTYMKRSNFKPVGLWFDVDGDWQRWCESENFNLDRFSSRNILSIDESEVLQLRHAGEIDDFTCEYEVVDVRRSYHREIDWQRVAQDYRGIVIAPYCWERRMTEHTFWYYGWDCASGCVWDLSIVETDCEPRNLKADYENWRELSALKVGR
jgi:hypothetical protein